MNEIIGYMEQYQPIRDYQLLKKVDDILHEMTDEELRGANMVLSIINCHLFQKHCEEKAEIDIRALVKTFGELDEISMEMILD